MQEAADFEIEGFVTAVPPDVPSGSFKVGNQLVITTGSTRFEGGVPGDIALGVKLEVEGVLAGGVLTASKIEFRDSVKLEGDVANLGASSFSLNGLPGITVTANSLTEFRGGISGLGDLANGNHVQVRGRLGSGANVIATEIDRTSTTPDNRVELQGPIQSITGTSPNQVVTILGVSVNTAGVVFQDIDDSVITRDAFFAKAVVGKLVKARGTLVGGGGVTWSEMELED